MTRTTHVHPSDLQGITRLATDATTELTALVEAVHERIARPLGFPNRGRPHRTRGITGLVYNCIREVASLVGNFADEIFEQFIPRKSTWNSTPEREAVLAAVNGVLGDHLAAGNNPLALPMRLFHNGSNLVLEKNAIKESIPDAGGKLLLLVHGLCMSTLQWKRQGHDHGEALAQDLGYTPLYLHFNSGLHTSINGRAFAGLLEDLFDQWPQPVEEFVMIAHSLGGLVARSACHYGGMAYSNWLRRLDKLIFLGTPHHGSPLERGGNVFQTLVGAIPYVSPLARLGKIRSAGITDLRYGNLLDEDWQGNNRFEPIPDDRRPVPLPKGVRSYAAAVTSGMEQDDLKNQLLGDGLVPLNSALGLHKKAERSLHFPTSRQWVGYGMGHMDLLNSPEVYSQIKQWLSL